LKNKPILTHLLREVQAETVTFSKRSHQFTTEFISKYNKYNDLTERISYYLTARNLVAAYILQISMKKEKSLKKRKKDKIRNVGCGGDWLEGVGERGGLMEVWIGDVAGPNLVPAAEDVERTSQGHLTHSSDCIGL